MFELSSDLKNPLFLQTVFFIIWTPVFWNIVCPLEYKTKFILRTFGDKYRACYFLSAVIFINSNFRNIWFFRFLMSCTRVDEAKMTLFGVGLVFFVAGFLLATAAMRALGITGTYFGDHFGIFHPSKITGYPFNLLNNPMYFGTFLQFFGAALAFRSPVGLFMSGLVLGSYYLFSTLFEEPFTDMIYLKKAEAESREMAKMK